ncbi:MAG: hypothetical protein ACM3X5_09025 [Bacillota bacterium]
MDASRIALIAGWISLLGGVVSGSFMGLRFHDEGWLGGYASFRRRLMRLGHIAFFGLGFLNLFFAFSVRVAPLAAPVGELAAIALMLGAITMPATCFLTAWKEDFRAFFPIPVTLVLAGIVSLLAGWGL